MHGAGRFGSLTKKIFLYGARIRRVVVCVNFSPSISVEYAYLFLYHERSRRKQQFLLILPCMVVFSSALNLHFIASMGLHPFFRY